MAADMKMTKYDSDGLLSAKIIPRCNSRWYGYRFPRENQRKTKNSRAEESEIGRNFLEAKRKRKRRRRRRRR